MLVSVVIPCYNVAAHISDAIDSALKQDHPSLEIIVVDNNSTDNTPAVLQAYAKRYPDKVKVLHETRKGASAARNLGWRNSNGAWIQFLDADDVLMPEKISRQLELAEQADFIIGTPVYEDLSGKRTALIPWDDPWKGIAHGMYAGQTSANLYRSAFLKKIDGWDEELPFTQDTDLAARILMANGRYMIDSAPICLVRDRISGKITQQDPAGIIVQHLKLREQLKSFLSKEQSAYWQANSTFFHLASCRLIRMLAIHDQKTAVELYHRYLPKNFKLSANRLLEIPAWYAVSVNTFGIEVVERWKSVLKRLFPASVWSRMKKYIG